MPYDRTQIANMAAGQVGISNYIGDVDSENSAEAIACRRYLDHTRGLLLEMRPWGWATRQVNLANLGGPLSGWGFRYAYPNNCRRVNCIVNPYQRTPASVEDKFKFKVIDQADGSGKAILCDQPAAVAEINFDQTNFGLYDSKFAQVHSLFLATLIAAPLRVNPAIRQEVTVSWQTWLAEAFIDDNAEAENDVQPASEFELGRA